MRSYTSLHDAFKLTSTAAYRDTVSRTITYNGAGQLWRQLQEGQDVGHLYGFDALGRLVADTLAYAVSPPECNGEDEASGGQCPYPFWSYWQVNAVAQYQYDEVGNRAGGTYGSANRIQTFGGCSYQTDPDGNVTQRNCPGSNITIEWDPENRPTRLTINGAFMDRYYDAGGRLVRLDSMGMQSFLLWDGERLFAELRGSDGGAMAEYSYWPGLDNLHALIVDGTQYYAHADGLGNVVALTDQTETLKRTYGYEPWGDSDPNGHAGQDYAGLAGRDRARFKGPCG
jgi:hypothetical protein